MKVKIKNWGLWSAMSAISLAMATSASAKDLATVNGQSISEEALLKAAENLGPRVQGMLSNPVMRRQFLDHIIDSRLMSKAAEEKGISKSKTFEERLAEAKTQILANLYIEEVVKEKTRDQDVKAYFEKNPKMFSKEEVKASHILLDDEKKANEVLKEALKKDAKFDELAKKHSKDSSAQNGGDLGFFGRGRMIPEFESVAFSMKKGEVHPKVVKSQFGYHIIKVTDLRGAEAPKFEDVKEEVRTSLERTVREDLLKSLRDKAKVKVDEDALKNMKI